ncbi:MAG: peptide ABC transporter substrate-binding protein [Chloroflexota bacterium]|nr:peptide ABC transporter substrate-binding protein [Chloroflexota bacterium]
MSTRTARAAALVTAILLLLPGCWPFQQSDVPQASGTPSARQTGTPSIVGPDIDVTPISLDTDALNIAGGADDPPSLDPALATDAYSHFIIRQLFSGLVTFDTNMNVVPDIAASMPSVSADGRVYTFALRKGVKFTDGQEVTASDFKYSFERATDPKLAGSLPATSLPAGLFLNDIVGVADKLAGKATEIAGVKALDPSTLEITIDEPKSFFLSKLTSGPAFVVQRSNVEESPRWTEHPRGTGPFRLEKWAHNDQMVLVANDLYYAGRPALPTINIWMGANATGELQQYEVGGLEVAYVPIDDIYRVSDRNNPMSKELQTVPDLSVTYLGFNVRQKPFEDPKIREAFSRVIDKQKIARVMFQSQVRQAAGFVPPDMAGYTPPNVDEGYDVTRARQLISESTYKEVKNLPRIRLYTAGDPIGPMLQEVYSQTLGIQIEVHEVEWTDYLEGLDRNEYPMFTMGWSADFPDPEAILGSLFRSDSPENHTGCRNSDVDTALSAAATETDRQRRMSIYREVEERILLDYPAVPLYHSVTYVLVKPYVTGLTVTPMGILSLKDVRLAAR